MNEQQPQEIPADSFLARFNSELARTGITEQKLIEELGIDRRTVVEIETGYFPNDQILTRLAKLFQTTPEALVHGVRQQQYLVPFGRRTLITILIALLALIAIGYLPWWPVIFVLYAVVLSSLAFLVRSYEIKDGKLIVQRSFWKNVYPITAASRAEGVPDLLDKSTCGLGNHGLFAFTGTYNGPHGRFVALVTDPARCVLVHLEGKALAVSPDSPIAFVETWNSIAAEKAAAPKAE
jgi:transcriptional regulator with XRE-family HTH domain